MPSQPQTNVSPLAADRPKSARHLRARTLRLLAFGLLIWATLATLSLAVGPGSFSYQDIFDILASKFFGSESPGLGIAIIWDLRLPRLLLASAVGASSGIAGCLAQGIFRNPLADPGVLGVGSGAALAVVVGFALGLDESALWATHALACGGAAAVMLLLSFLLTRLASTSSLLLAGVAIGAICGAATTCILSLRLEDWNVAQKAISWLMGSFDGRGWHQLAWTLPPLGVGVALAISKHRALDALGLGEETAASLGVNRPQTRMISALAIALMAGASTAAVGSIGFIGLIVPHLARALIGALHLPLLLLSGLFGACMLVVVDTITRAATPAHLAPGALTSLMGGGFFLWLLLGRKRNPLKGT